MSGVTTTVSTHTLQIVVALLAGGLVSGLLGYSQSQRARRKKLVAEAVAIAFARVEILYKIRRRPKDPRLCAADELAIRNEMHDIQTKTEYYISILSSESGWLGSSYERLIKEIRKQTEPLLQAAWLQKPLGVGAELKDAKHPQLVDPRKKFILDTQRYFNPLRRLIFAAAFRICKVVHNE
jgi:hypothetical protein